MRPEPTAREPRAPDSLSTRVCLALAEADGVHPWESAPLYGALDPSVLEALESQENRAWRLEFEAGTHAVAVTGAGDVVVDGVRYSDADFRRAIDALDDRNYSSSDRSPTDRTERSSPGEAERSSPGRPDEEPGQSSAGRPKRP